MSKILIVSYSMTGTTWKAASALAHLCRADRDTIRPLADYRGLVRSLWALWTALTDREPPIEPRRHDPADYDLVVLATPVWAARMASPMRSYIVAHRDRFARVAFLCTQGGSGADRVFESMSALCGQHPVATLALCAPDFTSDGCAAKLERFAAGLGQARPDRREPAMAAMSG